MVYTIVLACVFLLGLSTKFIKDDQKKVFFCILCFFILAFLSGFRYQNEYSDFMTNYQRVIQAESQTWYQAFSYSNEFLHQLIRKFIADVFRDPQWYFILSAVFVVGIQIKTFYKYSNSVFLCVLLYYCAFGYFSANNITRQAIAVAISLISWKFILEKKLIKYAIIMIIACLIHFSAVFFVPVFLLAYIDFTKITILSYTVIAALLLVFYRPIMLFLQRFIYSDYSSTSYGMNSSNPIHLVFAFLCGIMLLIYTVKRDKNRRTDPEIYFSNRDDLRIDNLILNGTFLYIVCIIISSTRILLFSRIGLYFAPCAILCIDRAINRMNNDKNRKLVYTGVVILFVSWFLINNYMGKLIPTPYTPFWQFPNRLTLY